MLKTLLRRVLIAACLFAAVFFGTMAAKRYMAARCPVREILPAGYSSLETEGMKLYGKKKKNGFRTTAFDSCLYLENDGAAAENERYMRRLVKAADKLSALIKCMEEAYSGNQEFSRAGETSRRAVEELTEERPEVKDFLEEFLPSYGKTLDELLETEEE